jgi:hypothetical protein
MSTIKQFNQILNQSDKNRFKFWETYRNQITSFLLNALDNKKRKNLIILGSGNLDDINLDQLSHLFDQIILSDIDINALKQVENKYKLNSKKLILKEMEYTGLIDSNLWNNFVKNMISYTSKNEINVYFSLIKKEIKHHKFTFDTTFDMVIVTPIYTQLLFQQILKDIEILASLNYPEFLLSYIEEQALEIMPTVIQSFNKNICLLLNDKSSLCVISDIFEANIDSQFYAQIKSVINDDVKMEDFYLNYVSTYGIGVGDFGLNHLIKSKDIKKSQWFEWPFNKHKSIFVKAVYFQK